MKKTLKRVLLVVTLLSLTLIIGAVFFLDNLVSSLRPTLIKMISARVGKEVSFEDVAINLFPQPAISVTNIALSEGAEENTKLKVDNVALNLELMSLLEGAPVISSVSISGAEIHASKDKDGFHLGPFGPKKGKTEPSVAQEKEKTDQDSQSPQSQPPRAETSQSKQRRIDFRINQITLDKSSFTLHLADESSPKSLHLGNIKGIVRDIDRLFTQESGDPSTAVDFQATVNKRGKISIEGIVSNPLSPKRTDLRIKLDKQDLASLTAFLPKTENNLVAAEDAISGTGGALLVIKNDSEQTSVTVELNLSSADLKFPGAIVKDKNTGPLVLSLQVQSPQQAEVMTRPLNTKVIIDMPQSSIEVSSALPGLLALRKNSEVKVDSLKGSLDLAGLSKLFPVLQEYGATGVLLPDLTALSLDSIKALAALKSGPQGVGSPDFLTKGVIELKDLGFILPPNKEASSSDKSQACGTVECRTYGPLNGKIELTPEKISSSDLKLNIAQGQLSLEGALFIKGGELFLNLRAANLQIADLYNRFASASARPLAGLIKSAQLKSNCLVANCVSTQKSTLVAQVSQGQIVGVNILGEVFRKISLVPAIGPEFLRTLSPGILALSKEDSTRFDSAQGDIDLQGHNWTLRQLSIEHSVFKVVLSGSGTLKPSQEMHLKGRFLLSSTESANIVQKQPKLSILLDEERRLVVPLSITKREGKTMVLPDLSDLGKKAVGQAVQKTIEKIIPKLDRQGLGGLFR